MNNHNEACSPLYYTYTYTTRRFDEDDRISIISHAASSYSAISNKSTTSQRINELKPKAKIIVSKTSTQANTKRKSSTENDSPLSKRSGNSLPIDNTSIMNESIQYNAIKPFFNWNKFNILCGYQSLQLGENGCLCKQPCPWKTEWTKSVHSHDYLVFKKLLKERATEANITQIQKDLPRTHPQCPTFSKNLQFRYMLRNVLVAYSIYDAQMGYVQGINMIAGVLLYHIKNSQQTFWALVQMMQFQQLRMIYLEGFQHLHAHCYHINAIIQRKVNDLYTRMNQLDIISQCFLNGWVLSLMSNAIPMEHMHQVIDRFRKQSWSYIYKLIVTYLLYLKEFLMLSNDQAEFLSNLSTKNSRELGLEWREMIESADKLIL